MSETIRTQKQRRRSQRIRRSSLALLPPPYESADHSGCPGDGVDHEWSGATAAAVFGGLQSTDGSACGSVWVDVDEEPLPRKSRRSSIGVHCLKPLGHPNIDSTSAPEAPSLQVPAESLVIEVMRKSFPDAEGVIISPGSFVIPDCKQLRSSLSETPVAVNSFERSLPCIATPMSPPDSVADQDNPLSAMLSGGHDLNLTCPVSCDDDTDDSLLICTPDIYQFHKNIHFKCSIDFSEIDQTPTKGDDSVNNSAESIHQSPIVSYVHDKLKSSDVVRKRRSTSSSKKDNRNCASSDMKLRKRGKPRNLLPSCEHMTLDSTATTYFSPDITRDKNIHGTDTPNRVKIYPFESRPSLSNSPNHMSPTYADDFMNPSNSFIQDTAPADFPDQLSESYSISVSVAEKCPEITDQLFPRCNPDKEEHSVKKSERSKVSVDECPEAECAPITGQSCSFTACSGRSVVPDPSPLDRDESDTAKTRSLGNSVDVVDVDLSDVKSQQMTDLPYREDCPSNVPVTLCLPISFRSSHSVVRHPQPKERNMATDVCKIFRSLAKKFSGSAKKKRKSSAMLSDGVVPIPQTQSGSTFRQTKECVDQPAAAAQVTQESVVNNPSSTSLDFSPFLPRVEAGAHAQTDLAVSPVWKLRSEVESNTESVVTVCEHVQNESPLVDENTVVSESPVKPDCIEVVPQKRSKMKRAGRRSVEAEVLQKECKEFMSKEQNAGEEIENSTTLRRSMRSRRNSLELLSYAKERKEPATEIQDTSARNSVAARQNKAETKVDEDLEDLYRNKHYKLPTERMWETLFESPDKNKPQGRFQSKRKYRRTISFETVQPRRLKLRQQKAMMLGWNVAGRKRKQISLDDVKSKIAALAAELSPQR